MADHDYTAYITTDLTDLPPRRQVVMVDAVGPKGPTGTVFRHHLLDAYDDADVIADAGQSLNSAGWELTSHWTADSIGWRARVTRSND